MATRTAAPGLSTDELARIRDTLATGRKPKVVFTAAAGQIAGQVGQVVELTDPELSDEWVVVRFGRDELPFSPADLQLPSKSKPAARSAPSPAGVADPAPDTAPDTETGPGPSLPGPREEPSVPTTTTANGVGRPAKAAKAAPAPATSTEDGATPAAAEVPAGKAPEKVAEPAAVPDEPAPVAAAAPAAAPRPKKVAKPKVPPSLTVTLTYSEGEWMVGATQGAKALAKPYVIKPAEALKMVSMIDVPGVHEAVDEIVSAARAEAEEHAEKLRAELAEIESRLAELREAG